MSVECMSWVLQNSTTSGSDKVVLIGLANHADPTGHNAYPAIDTLARYANLERRATQNVLRKLEAEGHITLTMQAGGDYRTAPDRRPNRYTVAMSAAQIARNAETGAKTVAARVKSGVQSSTPRQSEDRGAAGYRPGCSPVPNGMQSSTERGAVHCTLTVLEPSLNQQQPFGKILEFSSRDKAAVAAVKNLILQKPEHPKEQNQEPTPVVVLPQQPTLEGGAVSDGTQRTGFEDVPAAAQPVVVDSSQAETPTAAASLDAFLGGTRCKTRYPTDYQIYLENRERWLATRVPEFVTECVRLAQNGTGVEKSPYGALNTWLEQPSKAPASAFEIHFRLERGLTPKLERLPKRFYQSTDGRVFFVDAWRGNGDAISDAGLLAHAATRLWTLLPETYSPDTQPSPVLEPTAPSEARVSPEVVRQQLEAFRNRTKGSP
jgi:hypothetical protein